MLVVLSDLLLVIYWHQEVKGAPEFPGRYHGSKEMLSVLNETVDSLCCADLEESKISLLLLPVTQAQVSPYLVLGRPAGGRSLCPSCWHCCSSVHQSHLS